MKKSVNQTIQKKKKKKKSFNQESLSNLSKSHYLHKILVA